MTQAEIENALTWRYATKAFDSTKKLTDEQWSLLQESLLQAPSSYGLQPWKFLVVQNPEIRKQLKKVSWDQTQVTDSSHYVVFLYKEKLDEDHIQKYINRVAEVRGAPVTSLEGYKNMMIENLVKGPRSLDINYWAQRQSYIAMGFLLETAALIGVDACPMEGLDGKEYDKILGLEGSGWKTIASVALGFRSDQDKNALNKKVRFATKDIIEFRR